MSAEVQRYRYTEDEQSYRPKQIYNRIAILSETMRRALLSLLVAGLLVTTGCLGIFDSGVSRPPSDQRALDVVNQTQAATNSISTYRFSINGQMTTTGDDAKSYHISGGGVTDVREKELKGSTSLDARSRSTYIMDNKRYTDRKSVV